MTTAPVSVRRDTAPDGLYLSGVQRGDLSRGVGDELAHSSLRFGLGRFNTEEEVDFVIADVERAVNHLRDMSPLYEMAKQGIDLKTVQWAAH